MDCNTSCRHLDSDGDGCLSVSELKQALGDLGFGQRAKAAAEDMVTEASGQGVGSVTLAEFLQFVRRVGRLSPIWACLTSACHARWAVCGVMHKFVWLTGSPRDDPSNSRLTTGLQQPTLKLHVVRGNDETASGNVS